MIKLFIKTVKVRTTYQKGYVDKGINELLSKGILFYLACPYKIYSSRGTFPKGVSHFSIENTVRYILCGVLLLVFYYV